MDQLQARVDRMTEALSESGHVLAAEASQTAMQINMYRSARTPLPHWTPDEARNPEGTLRKAAARVFERVAEDEAALQALLRGGETFLEPPPPRKLEDRRTRTLRILAKSICGELISNGFDEREIVRLASEILTAVSVESKIK
ncbi:MAG TPA: hypothetical protein VLJ37_02165 [bacterium]|nr:hypothetical protein [bacterium]